MEFLYRIGEVVQLEIGSGDLVVVMDRRSNEDGNAYQVMVDGEPTWLAEGYLLRTGR